jgi:hypothetical protein
VAARDARHIALRRPAAALPHAATRRAARHVPVRAAAEWLLLTAALMPRTEAIRAPARLPDGEFGNGPRGRRLPLRARKGGANQGAVNRPFFFYRLD